MRILILLTLLPTITPSTPTPLLTRLANKIFYDQTRKILLKTYPPKKVTCIMRNFYDLELANHFVPHQWLLNRHLETEKLEKFTKIASLKCDVELTFDFILNAFKREEFYMKIRKGLMKIHHLGDKKQVKCIVRKLREINLTDFIENYQFLTPEEAILKSSIFIKNAKKKC